MLAYCPHDDVGFHVSISEIGEMSVESQYFVKGYLCGDEPGPPDTADGEYTEEDMEAWNQAIRRFHQSGSWFGRWKTCSACGCVLLPDNAGDRCAEHIEPTRV
jgi:hypothetical protein